MDSTLIVDRIKRISKYIENQITNSSSVPLDPPTYILFTLPLPDSVSKNMETFPQGILLGVDDQGEAEKLRDWLRSYCPDTVVIETDLLILGYRKIQPLRLIINKT